MAFYSKGGNLISMDRGQSSDINYRYKFERVIIAKEGKNKGRKTVICNIVQITRSIMGTNIQNSDNQNDGQKGYGKDVTMKTAKHICRFVGKKLGSQCRYVPKRKCIIVSGSHEQRVLQNIMFDYVEAFTFCPQCNLPELPPAVLSKIECRSCGYNGKKKMKKNKTQKAKHGDDDDDSDDDANRSMANNDPLSSLRNFLAQNASLSEIYEKIKLLTLAHGMNRNEQIKLVIQGLMELDNDSKKMIASIGKYKQILAMFTSSKEDAETFLALIEHLIMRKVELLDYSYAILNCLYDEELLDADEIIEWYESADDKVGMREKAKPFIEWLNEDDSDDDVADDGQDAD